jgi:hypothetical protein
MENCMYLVVLVVFGCRMAKNNFAGVKMEDDLVALSGIASAVAAAGTQAQLADRLGVSQQAVSKWLRRGWVPVRRAGEIEAEFNIPCTRLASPRIMALLGAPVTPLKEAP